MRNLDGEDVDATSFVVLMFVEIRVLYEWFSVDPAGVAPLWRIS